MWFRRMFGSSCRGRLCEGCGAWGFIRSWRRLSIASIRKPGTCCAEKRRGSLRESRLVQRKIFPRSIFNQRLQPGQRLIPLLGNGIEVLLHSFNGLGIEFEASLAAPMIAAHDSYPLEDPKMFGDRLPGQPRTLGQLRDRTRLPGTELGHQRQPHLVAECGKYASARLPFEGRAATSFA